MLLWHMCMFSTKDYVCLGNQLGYYDISCVNITNMQIILTDNIYTDTLIN